jgi:serine/threonine-protein kinase
MLVRPAAVKLIRATAFGSIDSAESRRLTERFEREAQATAALRSAHTVQLYDFGITEDGTFYYVMELLDGLDLQTFITRFGPVSAERAIHILHQACHSLSDAHSHGLVHRDIKPANLFLCRMGLEYDFVKVLDFGLVKVQRPQDPQATLVTLATGSGSHLPTGTPAYMPPEIALGERTVDGRADLYALGCVGYWLLTGELVFKEESPMAMLVQHVRGTVVPPSQRTEIAIPASLEQLILSCLEKDPRERPQSADDLARRLAEIDGANAWTDVRARRWWETNLPRGSAGVASAQMVPPEETTPILLTRQDLIRS